MPRCYRAPRLEIVANMDSRNGIAWGRFPSGISSSERSQALMLGRNSGKLYNEFHSFAYWYRRFKIMCLARPNPSVELFFGSEILRYRIPDGGVTQEIWLDAVDHSGFKFGHILCS
ncbi:hypothetical protein EYR41_004881 [Orbilia oligospora]|uniref:Uncharacterized protein n=1 Tax=Orbilia oligospora TaxID=2813651 RepID=A0A7C8KBZ7_ORBOL|nr:hypothetical protein TWF751_010795 [Orbilia oligospora]TGJ68796.1 hypothetical protein EYR41_004881 [Orbilia oligospora]